MQIFEILKALLTPIIALLALWIAYQQFQVQKYRTKFDLFERRMRIYESVRETLVIVFRDASVEKANFTEFGTAIRHAKFLFDGHLLEYLKLIDQKIVSLVIINRKLYGEFRLPVGEARDKVAEEEYELNIWITKQLPVFEDYFFDFMKINKI